MHGLEMDLGIFLTGVLTGVLLNAAIEIALRVVLPISARLGRH